jgi:signal transduction histidine kinase
MKKIIYHINHLLTPTKYTRRDGIAYWQEKLFLKILFLSVVLGIIAYGFVLFLLFKRNLSFSFRATCFPLMIYFIGLIVIISLGPFGDGPVWLFCFPLITGLLLGYKRAFWALIINAVTIGLLIFFIHIDFTNDIVRSNFELWQAATGNAMERWIAISLNFMVLNIATTLSITTILKGLQKAHDELEQRVEERTFELSKTNETLNAEIKDRKIAEVRLMEFNDTLEEKIKERTIEVNMLNEHLIYSEESERKKLASELHDSVAQSLAFSVSKLKHLKESETVNDSENLSVIQKHIEQAIQEVRLLIHQLCPPIINDFGIDIAIGYLIEQSNKINQTNIVYFNSLDETIQMSETKKITLYRAVNELVSNFIKHSGVNEAEIEILKNGNNVFVRFEDNGLGFDLGTNKKNIFSGFGLYGLSERCKNMGGNIQIDSIPGKGTKILICAPVN